MPVFLIPALAVAGLAVLAATATDTLGPADAIWLSWAALFAILEWNALANETEGDTLSEKLRAWFRTKTPAGRVGFTAVVIALVAWLIPHILIG